MHISDPNKHQTELAGAPAKDEAPRESLIDRIRPFILIFLLLFLPTALFHAFTDYMYVYRVPAGTKVVGTSTIPQRSRLGEYIYDSVLIRKWHCNWLIQYLDYRHYIIPDGAEEIESCAFWDIHRTVRSVRIPGSVKKIGHGAFEGCFNLREVVIQNGVEEIGFSAFRDCMALESIRIPDSVKFIGDYAFDDCKTLRQAVIAGGSEIDGQLRQFGKRMFLSCSKLEEVRLPGPVIEESMFDGCAALKKVEIAGQPLRTVGHRAFAGCTELSEIMIPDNLKSIGEGAFLGCAKLPPVTLGHETVLVGCGAFTGTGCRLTVPDDHPCLRLENGLLYKSETFRNNIYTLLSCVSEPDDPCIVAPPAGHADGAKVYLVGEYAFSGCTGLKHIELPDSVVAIGGNAFSGCTGLTKIRLPEGRMNTDEKELSGLEYISDGAFRGCSGLAEITIPPNVTSIGESAFAGCTGLKHVTLPDSLKSISPGAFSGCESLDPETRERLNKLTRGP